jgi:hypothetical protein
VNKLLEEFESLCLVSQMSGFDRKKFAQLILGEVQCVLQELHNNDSSEWDRALQAAQSLIKIRLEPDQTVAVHVAPTITTTTLPSATVGVPYTAKISATAADEIICNGRFGVAPGITTTALPPGTVGVPYNAELSATGNDQTNWTAVSA